MIATNTTYRVKRPLYSAARPAGGVEWKGGLSGSGGGAARRSGRGRQQLARRARMCRRLPAAPMAIPPPAMAPTLCRGGSFGYAQSRACRKYGGRYEVPLPRARSGRMFARASTRRARLLLGSGGAGRGLKVSGSCERCSKQATRPHKAILGPASGAAAWAAGTTSPAVWHARHHLAGWKLHHVSLARPLRIMRELQ